MEIDFSLIIPTRNRIDLFYECIQSFYNKAMNKDRVEFIVLIDADDYTSVKQITEYLAEFDSVFRVIISSRDTSNFSSNYMNFGANCSRGRLLWALNDDVEMVTDSWDLIIDMNLRDEFECDPCYIMTDDDTHVAAGGHVKQGVCFPIVSRAWVSKNRGIFPHEINHAGADYQLFKIFNHRQDRILDLIDQVSLIHKCPHNGKRKRDETINELYDNKTAVVELNKEQMKRYVQMIGD